MSDSSACTIMLYIYMHIFISTRGKLFKKKTDFLIVTKDPSVILEFESIVSISLLWNLTGWEIQVGELFAFNFVRARKGWMGGERKLSSRESCRCKTGGKPLLAVTRKLEVSYTGVAAPHLHIRTLYPLFPTSSLPSHPSHPFPFSTLVSESPRSSFNRRAAIASCSTSGSSV